MCIANYATTLCLITLCSSLSDADAYRFNISAQDKQDCIEEVNTELSVYFGILYFLIEVLKDSDDFAEELSK